MAKNYDNYGYDNDGNGKPGLLRRLLIVLMVIVSIILIVYLITSCSKKPENKKENNTEVTIDYESELLSAGKNYYSIHSNENPSAPGECSLVELQNLVDEKLIDASKFNNCNQNTTYVKKCMLEDERYQYTPWISCAKYSSEEKYDSLKQGTMSDIIADKTYVEFKFVPLEAKKGGDILGEVETYWKSEIPYEKYKTLSSVKYYRYRDKLYRWNLIKRSYYSINGATDSESKVKDYYITAPNSVYINKGNYVTAYKWYIPVGTKDYYKGSNGEKGFSATAPSGYPYRDPEGVDVTRYRTRTVIDTYSPILYYVCATSATGTKWIYQTSKCGTTNNPQYNYTREVVFSCATEENGELVRANIVNANATCKKYSAWSSPTTTVCDTTKTDICQSATVTFYNWYRIINESRKYYPSNKTTADGEKTYYTSAPVKNAIKDTDTKAIAYTWYKEVSSTSTKYTVTAPSGYYKVTKSSDYKWTDWTDWSKTDPKINDGRDRVVEKRTKIKLQEIQGVETAGWQNITTEYLTEENLIKLFKGRGYNVNSLEDITDNGQIKYQLVTFVRNKKESM